MNRDAIKGAAIRFQGIVQGVGFRPLVYRRALSLGLTGTVQNTDSGVHISVDGPEVDIRAFYTTILKNPPTLAEIQDSSLRIGDPHGYEEFVIIGSSSDGGGFTPVSPDIATCDACIEEVLDPADRRFRYPFTNCTDCGPRFTIIRSIPYDRKNTTMQRFPLCRDCEKEFEDPLDRRYHAQPNACDLCGPELRLITASGTPDNRDPLGGAIGILRQGGIVAVKGLGGYHLAVSPMKGDWIRRLRERKRRPGKPLALMARDVDTVRRYCDISEGEEDLLRSPQRPIVLLGRRADGERLPGEIAPDTNRLGVMLPYTPLHHLLIREGPELLVMTSANLSEEPLCYLDDEAHNDLDGMADAFLVHNRDIHRPCDDSVVTVVDDFPVFIRRSRGYVPRRIETPYRSGQLLSAGAHEKNTFCVFKDGNAFVSHHIGDLNNEKSIDAYMRGMHDFLDMFRVTPEAVACDLHPDYESTLYAERLSIEWEVPLIRVQHHHAHISAVLGEKNINGRVIGVALDGTGYGPDETVWGGEFLAADTARFERLGHYAAVPMPGGDRCVEEISRMGVSYLLDAYGSAADIPDFAFTDRIGSGRIEILERMISAGVNTPYTSSCGRLFDAVSSIIGLCDRPTYDAQGAILLEHAAEPMEEIADAYSCSIDEDLIVHHDGLIREVVDDLRAGRTIGAMARRFHAAVVLSGVRLCEAIRDRTGMGTVVLGGGVFQNRIILKHFIRQLGQRDFSVYFANVLPPNDGGISYGQGITALAQLEGGAA